MRKILFPLGLCPRPRYESLQRSPRPPSCISGGLLLRGGRGKRDGKEREGKRRRGMKGVKGRGLPQKYFGLKLPLTGSQRSFRFHDYSVKHRRTRPISLLCPLTRPVTNTVFAIAAAVFLNFFLNNYSAYTHRFVRKSVRPLPWPCNAVGRCVCVCSDVTFLTLCASSS